MARKVINYGLIGFGMIGKVHLMGLKNMPLIYTDLPFEVRLKSLLTTHPDKNKDRAEAMGFAEVTDDKDQFFKELDVVDICTPNALHREMVELAGQNGIAPYCEKPLADNLDDAREMERMVREAGVPNQVALTLRSLPAVAEAKAFIEAGRLGEVTHFRGQLYHGSYNTPKRPTSWRLSGRLAGGGALADLGIHIIDLVRYLLGDVESVCAKTRTVYTRRPKTKDAEEFVSVDVDDWGLIDITLQNGGVGSIEASRLASGATRSTYLEIFGTRGSLTLFPTSEPYRARLYDNERGFNYVGGNIPESPIVLEINSAYPAAKLSLGQMVDSHLAGLVRFLKTVATSSKGPGVPDFREAFKTQEILDAAYRSSAAGSSIIKL